MIPLRSKERQRSKPLRKGTRFNQSRGERGVSITQENFTFIPADMKLRCLRDQMIIEPLDVIQSRILILPPSEKTLRGRVLAVGPGYYPHCYDSQDKQKRTKMWCGEVFHPAQTKVGDIVRLEGWNQDSFFWGSKYCVHAREADVVGIET